MMELGQRIHVELSMLRWEGCTSSSSQLGLARKPATALLLLYLRRLEFVHSKIDDTFEHILQTTPSGQVGQGCGKSVKDAAM